MAAAEEIGVAEEVVVETTHPAKKRTRHLKKDLETACKNMLLLAVNPGLKEARKFIVAKVDPIAFIALLIGKSLTCCKRICWGDIITRFLFAA